MAYYGKNAEVFKLLGIANEFILDDLRCQKWGWRKMPQQFWTNGVKMMIHLPTRWEEQATRVI